MLEAGYRRGAVLYPELYNSKTALPTENPDFPTALRIPGT